VGEIARSFLVSEAAMAKRLVRARYKIKAAKIPYRVPSATELPQRLRSVLSVVYLIYNTGADDPERASLRADALRLGRSIVQLMPDEPEAAGLVAVMLLGEARQPARMSNGSVVVLRDQDRSQWDRSLIDEGHAIVRACVRRNKPGPYQLQASIQAVHCDARTFDDTDWPQIIALYDHLLVLQPTPIVALNRAIALAESEGPAASLAALDPLSEDLDNYPFFHAARGSVLRRLGRVDAARTAFRRAADLAPNNRDRRFLEGQIEELG
jgi:RNA polymerase sigma-70 factor (ECF subfamily)